jgi:hypothetical protein
MALRFSGRLNVIVVTPLSLSTSSVWYSAMITSSVVGDLNLVAQRPLPTAVALCNQ